MGCHVWLCSCTYRQFGSLFHVEVCEGNSDCEEYIPVLRYQDALLCLEEMISTL